MIKTTLSLGQSVLGLLKRQFPGNKTLEDGAGAADTGVFLYNTLSTDSLNKITAATIINPLIVIEEDIKQEDYMPDLMQLVQLQDIRNILNYYTVNSSVNGIKVGDIMAPVATSRSGFLNYELHDQYQGFEALKEQPTKEPEGGGITDIFPGLKREKDEKVETPFVAGANLDNSKYRGDVVEYPPLALGRTVTASTIIEGKEIKFPITFKMTPVLVSNQELIRIFGASGIQNGLKMRLLMLKTGEITRPELFSGSDMIKEKFKAKDKDYTNYLKEMDKKASNNTLATIRTGSFNYNSEANTIIITSNVARQIEINNGIKFSNPNSRKGIFKSVMATRIIVVDRDRGTFTFYLNGIARADVYTRKDLESTSKKSSSADSIESLVKLLNGGR